MNPPINQHKGRTIEYQRFERVGQGSNYVNLTDEQYNKLK
jgi:hypothetical protein